MSEFCYLALIWGVVGKISHYNRGRGRGGTVNQKGGQADIIHFLNFEYFKNYAKHKKSENIFILIFQKKLWKIFENPHHWT